MHVMSVCQEYPRRKSGVFICVKSRPPKTTKSDKEISCDVLFRPQGNFALQQGNDSFFFKFSLGLSLKSMS